MTRTEYQEYLASREWALKREAVRERSGNRCEREVEGFRCPSQHEATHHKTYASIGKEPLEDLLAVCNACHLWLSGKVNVDPLVEGVRFRDEVDAFALSLHSRGSGLWSYRGQLFVNSIGMLTDADKAYLLDSKNRERLLERALRLTDVEALDERKTITLAEFLGTVDLDSPGRSL